MRLRRSGLLTAIVVLAVIVYAVAMLNANRGALSAARADLAEKRAEADELRRENAELEYLIAHAEDPEILAEEARRRLGLVLPGDRIFRDINH